MVTRMMNTCWSTWKVRNATHRSAGPQWLLIFQPWILTFLYLHRKLSMILTGKSDIREIEVREKDGWVRLYFRVCPWYENWTHNNHQSREDEPPGTPTKKSLSDLKDGKCLLTPSGPWHTYDVMFYCRQQTMTYICHALPRLFFKLHTKSQK